MLSSSKRPRAPSAAALRVLYQLAYITSGAALGVGILCAEERRRRCKLVQKVADNARRLHSNPRYCRNTSLDQIDWTDDSTANFILTRAALKSASGVRAAGLPSVVDQSYEQLLQNDGSRSAKKRRRKGNETRASRRTNQSFAHPSAVSTETDNPMDKPRLAKDPLGFVETESSAQQESATFLPSRYSRDLKDDLAANSIPLTTYQPNLHNKNSLTAPSRRQRRHVRKQHAGEPETSQIGTRPTVHKLQSLTSSEILRSENISRFDEAEELDEEKCKIQQKWNTITSWLRSQPISLQRLDQAAMKSASSLASNTVELKENVALFFALVAKNSKQQNGIGTAPTQIGSALLRIACDQDVLEVVKGLLSWKMASACITTSDKEILSKLWQTSREQSDEQEVIESSEDIIDASRMQRIEESQRTAILHEQPAPVTTASSVSGPEAMGPEIKSLLVRLSSSSCPSAMKKICIALLREGNVKAAIRLIISFPSLDMTLAPSLFSAALESQNLDLCVPILAWTGGSLSDNFINHTQIEEFIDVATQLSDYRHVHDLFRSKGMNIQGNCALLRLPITEAYFSQQCLLNICIPYARQSSQRLRASAVFKAAFSGLSMENRRPIRELCSEQYINTIASICKTSGDLEKFTAEYRLAIQQRNAEGQFANASSLPLAAVKTYLKAGRTALAREILQDLDLVGRTTISLLATGLILSYEKDWPLLDLWISSANGQDSDFEYENDHQTMLNLMYNYSRHHKCEETAQFVSKLLTACAQPPSYGTCLLLFKSAISDKRLDMLEKWWSEFCKADMDLCWDQTVVWELLSHYRETHQVDVGLFTWIANVIQKYTPWLCSEDGKLLCLNAHAEKVMNDQKFVIPENRNKKRILRDIDRNISSERHESAKMTKSDYVAQQQKHPVVKQSSLSDKSVFGSPDQPAFASELLIGISPEKNECEDHTIGLAEVENVDSRPHPIVLAQSTVTESAAIDLAVDSTSLTSISAGHDDDGNSSLEDVKTTKRITLRDRLTAAMALRDYSTVIALYINDIHHASDKLALRMAVQASIRLHKGNTRHAESLLEIASKRQIATNDAGIAIKIARLRDYKDYGREAAEAVYDELLSELQQNSDAAGRLKEYIFVEAANLLIHLESPDLAAKLMRTLDQALTNAGKPMSLVAMTVWLRARTEKADFGGAIGLTQHVLNSGIMIDYKFRKMVWQSSIAASKSDHFAHSRRAVMAKQLAALSEDCLVRLDKQQADSSRFAWDLVRTIITIADPENAEASLRDMSETADSRHLVFRVAKTMEGFSGLQLPASSLQARNTDHDANSESESSIDRRHEHLTAGDGSDSGEEQSDAMQRLMNASRHARENLLVSRDSAFDSRLVKKSDVRQVAEKVRSEAPKAESSYHYSTSRKPKLASTAQQDIEVQRNHRSTQRKEIDEKQLIETDDITNVLHTDVRQTLVSAAG